MIYPGFNRPGLYTGNPFSGSFGSSSPDSLHGQQHSIDINFSGHHDGMHPALIKHIVQQVEAKLLSNAKSNRSSGLTLSGYGT